MNDVKLTDFSADELNHLLVAVMYDMITDTTKNQTKIQSLELWRIQILNAISTVKMRERTEQN